MNRIKDYKSLTIDMVGWLCKYTHTNNINSFVVGVSGGIDSAVASTLAVKTGKPTYLVGMPLNQNKEQETLSDAHMYWLSSMYPNVKILKADLSESYAKLMSDLTSEVGVEYTGNPMAKANTKSRLRMVTLYHVAANVGGIVVGTGNKVEDYGVGFYTKYGDGGVDIAPIADLYKSEVYSLAESLQIIQPIQDAPPTDGLWNDGRTDEEQIGATYEELEWAMNEIENPSLEKELNERLAEVMRIYLNFNHMNSHKMNPIPIFKFKR